MQHNILKYKLIKTLKNEIKPNTFRKYLHYKQMFLTPTTWAVFQNMC